MNWLTLSQIKQQLRIEPDMTMEDDLLTLYGESAETIITKLCRRTYQEFLDEYGEIPATIKHASLMLVDVSYQNRSPLSMTSLSAVPYTFDMLIKPYMRLGEEQQNE